ncbi:MAG: Archaeal Type pilin, N-terminal [Thermoplasmata archaeon]|jgi:hypothetical protein|nr:Archaeal Type pilin, N-terminal [Thermoplasmata archaeon]
MDEAIGVNPVAGRKVQARRERRRRPDGQAAVSDTVGNILLVGITVGMAAGLGFLLLSFDGPEAVPQVNLGVRVEPGNANWGNGDETIVIHHGGGDAVEASAIAVRYSINNGPVTTVTGNALATGNAANAAVFADGRFSIGESWRSSNLNLPATAKVHVNVVHRGGASSALVAVDLIPAQVSAGSNCPFDTSAPTGSWTQSPPDLTITSNTAVTLTLQLTDGCAGVDPANVPHIYWAISPTAPTDKGAMTSLGNDQWRATIPVPAGGWSQQGLKTLQYYATPLADLRGNSASSIVRNDVIELVGATMQYITVPGTTVVAPTPAMTSPGNMGAADGLFATLTEANTTPACTPGTVTLSTNAEASTVGTWASTGTAPTDATTDNSGYRTFANAPTSTSTGTQLRLGFPNPTAGCTITSVKVLVDQRVQTTFIDDGRRIYACFAGSACGTTATATQLASSSDAVRTFDLTTLRPGGGSWSWTDVNNFETAIQPVQSGAGRDGTWRVDHVQLQVISVTSPAAYTGIAQLDWTGIVAGSAHYVDIGYTGAADESFVVNVWDWSTSTFNTRSPQLSATTLSQYVYLMTASEVSGSGQVRLRIADFNPVDTTLSTVNLDYARIDTA